MALSTATAEFKKPFKGTDLYLGSNVLPAPEHRGVVNRLATKLADAGIAADLEKLNKGLNGDRILVLLPTNNKQKVEVLKYFFPDSPKSIIFAKFSNIDSKVCINEKSYRISPADMQRLSGRRTAVQFCRSKRSCNSYHWID